MDASYNISNWNRVITPTSSDDFVVYFANYSDATTTGGKVWKIDASNTADVTISFTPAENKFKITNALTITAPDTDYITYSNGNKINIGDAEAYIAEGVANGEVKLKQLAANSILDSKTGVLLKGATSYEIYSTFGDETNLADVSTNLLIGSGDYTYDITGKYNDTDEYTAYILADGVDGVGFYIMQSEGNKTLGEHKAFLAVPKTDAADNAPFLGFGGGDTTGINSVERGALSVEGCYTLDGRRVEQPTKGLYIINGKKVVVK